MSIILELKSRQTVLDIKCFVCNSHLKWYLREEGQGVLSLEVVPCEKCLEDANQKGAEDEAAAMT